MESCGTRFIWGCGMTSPAGKFSEEQAMAIRAKRGEQEVSNPDKVFWPEEGYTKGDLAAFYRKVFPRLHPFVKDRILTLERCPDGLAGQCFYQKEKPASMP